MTFVYIALGWLAAILLVLAFLRGATRREADPSRCLTEAKGEVVSLMPGPLPVAQATPEAAKPAAPAAGRQASGGPTAA